MLKLYLLVGAVHHDCIALHRLRPAHGIDVVVLAGALLLPAEVTRHIGRRFVVGGEQAAFLLGTATGSAAATTLLLVILATVLLIAALHRRL